ncbi:MAG: biotin--[acetyl-CoA-carboxylase] ligase family protein [Bifidobacteriaceae bacterium]|nr:biotin--[acetyl-CoA-carboxylase] ligase family protein [Bifidobacteriaceae bacterium]
MTQSRQREGAAGGLDLARLRSMLVDAGPFARVDVVDEVDSTNAALLAAEGSPDCAARLPHLSALLAEHQTAGRGRLERRWVSAQGSSVLVSVLLRPPPEPRLGLSWLPLAAGLATCRALAPFVPTRPRMVWPNDVVVRIGPAAPGQPVDVPGWGAMRKVAGILTEVCARPHPGKAMAPSGDTSRIPRPQQLFGNREGRGAIVLGIGINVTQDAHHLPVPWAASLRTAGAPGADRNEVAIATLMALARHYAAWEAGDPTLRPAIEARCVSVGDDVEAWAGGGARLRGRGLTLDDDGALVIATTCGNRAVSAADVRKIRHGRADTRAPQEE